MFNFLRSHAALSRQRVVVGRKQWGAALLCGRRKFVVQGTHTVDPRFAVRLYNCKGRVVVFENDSIRRIGVVMKDELDGSEGIFAAYQGKLLRCNVQDATIIDSWPKDNLQTIATLVEMEKEREFLNEKIPQFKKKYQTLEEAAMDLNIPYPPPSLNIMYALTAAFMQKYALSVEWGSIESFSKKISDRKLRKGTSPNLSPESITPSWEITDLPYLRSLELFHFFLLSRDNQIPKYFSKEIELAKTILLKEGYSLSLSDIQSLFAHIVHPVEAGNNVVAFFPSLSSDIIRYSPGEIREALKVRMRVPDIHKEAIRDRVDLRHLEVIAVDELQTHIIDDAFSYEETPNGCMIYVHITDPIPHIHPHSLLSEFACKRMENIYGNGVASSLFPIELCEAICLSPTHENLAVTFCTQIDTTKNIINYFILRSVIKSITKIDYHSATTILENLGNGQTPSNSTETALAGCQKMIPVISSQLDPLFNARQQHYRTQNIGKGFIHFLMNLATQITKWHFNEHEDITLPMAVGNIKVSSPLRRYLDFITLYQLVSQQAHLPPLFNSEIALIQEQYDEVRHHTLNLATFVDTLKTNQKIVNQIIQSESGTITVKARIRDIKKVPDFVSLVDMMIELDSEYDFTTIHVRANESPKYARGLDLKLPLVFRDQMILVKQ